MLHGFFFKWFVSQFLAVTTATKSISVKTVRTRVLRLSGHIFPLKVVKIYTWTYFYHSISRCFHTNNFTFSTLWVGWKHQKISNRFLCLRPQLQRDPTLGACGTFGLECFGRWIGGCPTASAGGGACAAAPKDGRWVDDLTRERSTKGSIFGFSQEKMFRPGMASDEEHRGWWAFWYILKYYITATEELTCHIDDWLLKKGRLEYLIFTSQICGPKTVDLLLASLGCLSQSSSGCAARLVGSLLSNFDTFAPKSN